MGDRQAMQFTHVQPDLRTCRRHVAAHERQRHRLGYAPWTIIEKASSEIVGWGGLYNDPFDPGWGIEVAYLFAPAAWGHGHATELVRCCLHIAETRLWLGSVVTFAHPENAASRRVLEKVGFLEQEFLPVMHRYLYRRWL
jgi:RimJ/RimL family protein N-acetyltransferase